MYKRFISQKLKSYLSYFPVVLLNGARQVGKSTLAKYLHDEGSIQEIVTLDDFTNLEVAHSDPEGFIKQFSQATCIDEVQRAPNILQAIKRAVDQNKKPGQFLLTGSANILQNPSLSESLVGRMGVVNLEGMSLSEKMRLTGPSKFLEQALESKDINALIQQYKKNYIGSMPSFSEVSTFIKNTCFPEPCIKSNYKFTQAWVSSYQKLYLEKDIRDITRSIDEIGFLRIQKLLSLQTGQLLNVKNLSTAVGLDQRTVRKYLNILLQTFQIQLLKPWHSNIRKRYVKTDKVYAMDPGYAYHFLGIGDQKDGLDKHPHKGHLIETWALSELRKLASLTDDVSIYFYQTHQGKEVDFVLERGETLLGIECKTTTSIRLKDITGLQEFTRSHNAKGLVLYFGSEFKKLSDTVIACPFSVLMGGD